MSLLTEKPPKFLTISGKEHVISTDFRDILRIIEVLENQEKSEAEKALLALTLFYVGDVPSDLKQAARGLSDFFAMGKKTEAVTRKEAGSGGDATRPDLSFTADAGMIYAAFLAQYGLDLIEIKELHFWQFRALLDGLEPERRISEIRRCRKIRITKTMSEGEKRYYKEMKKAYALSPGSDEISRKIEQAILSGEDISKLIREENHS